MIPSACPEHLHHATSRFAEEGTGAPGGQLLHLGFHGHTGELGRKMGPSSPLSAQVVLVLEAGRPVGQQWPTFCDQAMALC